MDKEREGIDVPTSMGAREGRKRGRVDKKENVGREGSEGKVSKFH